MRAPQPDRDELAKMHHYFAVEFDNCGWDLAERDSLDDRGRDELLHYAHAAALHWRHTGEDIFQDSV